MRINLRHGAAVGILAAFSVLGPAAAHAAAIGGPAAGKPAAGQDQMLLPAANPCSQWDWWKHDSCRHQINPNDNNKCTFRPDYVYHDQYGRYNEEGYYTCTVYPKPTPYGQSAAHGGVKG